MDNIAFRQTKFALVIGISKYENTLLKDLVHARPGAEKIARALEQIGYQTKLVVDNDALTEPMVHAVDWLFTDRKPQDTLLFYFAGHGFPTDGDVFLTSYDFIHRKDYGISLSLLRDFYFSNTDALNVLLVLDCCYSGGFSTIRKSPQSPEQRLGSLIRELTIGHPPGRNQKFENKVVIAATGKYEVTPDNSGTKLSPLTANILPVLNADEKIIEKIVDINGLVTSTTLKAYLNSYFKLENKFIKIDYTFEDLQSGGGSGLIIADFSDRYPLKSKNQIQEDWGEAVDVKDFLGREAEMTLLTEYLRNQCTLLTLVGIGGIGKTSLAVKLVNNVKANYDFVFWRSLRNGPKLKGLIADCIKFISNQTEINLPEEYPSQITLLIYYLKRNKCLIVLDNLEAILKPANDGFTSDTSLDSQFRIGYEDYSDFIQSIGKISHVSSLILTTREKPKSIERLELISSQAKSLFLTGIDDSTVKLFMRRLGLTGEAGDWKALTDKYSGNPLALKLVSENIKVNFEGSVGKYLSHETNTSSPIDDVLEEQFNRLAVIEKSLMYWLAIERELISKDELVQNMFVQKPKKVVARALEVLMRRTIVETSRDNSSLTLQPVVMEFVTEKIITKISEEVASGDYNFLRTYALVKAQSKEYIRAAQRGLILRPIFQNLMFMFRYPMSLENHFIEMLNFFRKENFVKQAYSGGNILNLLLELKGDLSGIDFSSLNFIQVSFQGINLHFTNFTGSNFEACIFTENFDSILCVDCDPKDTVVAAGSIDGTIRIWNILSGQQETLLEGHNSWVRDIKFSPSGNVLASASSDSTIRIWDLNTGRCMRILSGQEGEVLSLSFTKDGKRLISAGADKIIRVWNISDGECVQLLKGHEGRIWAVDFMLDDTVITSASEDGKIVTWDLVNEKTLDVFSYFSSEVHTFAYEQKKSLLASGHGNKIIIWDTTKKAIRNIIDKHEGRIWAIKFDADGKRMITCGEDLTIRIWDMNTGICLKSLQGHTNWIRSLALTSNGQFIVSGSEDQTVRIWDIGTGECVKIFRGSTNRIRSVALNYDATLLINTSDDHTLRLWDLREHSCIQTFVGHTNRVRHVQFSPDGKQLVSASDDYTIKLWSVEDSSCILTLRGHENRVMSAIFSPKGGMIASSSEDRTVKLWDIKTGSCIKTFKGFGNIVWEVAISPDGKLIAAGSDDQTVRIWDINSEECLTVINQPGKVRAIKFDSNSDALAVGGTESIIKIIDIRTGKILQTFHGHKGWVQSIKFLYNSGMLISGSYDKSVKLWDISNGTCLATFLGHSGRVMAVDANENKAMCVSVSEDETIRLWSLLNHNSIDTFVNLRPYEGMQIANSSGLSNYQRNALVSLGANV